MLETKQVAVDQLIERYENRKAIIGLIGLGYVGLPLAKAFLEAEFKVVGIDIDPAKIDALNSGRSYIRHLPATVFNESIKQQRFVPTIEFAELRSVDAIIICVPTPLTRHREPDLSYVENTTRAIVPHLRRGQLLVLESTTYPGTSQDVIKPILEASGFASGRDFFLAYSPEREDPGNLDFSTTSIPKIVGADGKEALKLASALYRSIVPQIVPVSSPQVAEAAKLLENIFRSVNIALVNELKIIYTAMGIDIWEVIGAAKTKPFGFMPFYPGPGLGGHCIPIDPFYLTWKAREYDISTRFIELAGEVNTSMPRYVVARLAEELSRRERRSLNGSKILVIGLAYKRNVDDTRESPALKLIELLEEQGASCDVHDPFVQVIPPTREHPRLAGRRSIALDANAIARFDAVLIATDHDDVDYAQIVRVAKLVIDTRNACERARVMADNVVKA